MGHSEIIIRHVMWNRGLLSPETLSPIDPENPDETKRALLKKS